MRATDPNCERHWVKTAGLLALCFCCLLSISTPAAGSPMMSVRLDAQLGIVKTSSPAKFIVRDTQGLSGLNFTCFLLGCQVLEAVGDPKGQLFLIQTSGVLSAPVFLAQLLASTGIADAEPDQTGNTPPPPSDTMPWYAYDQLPLTYYGATVWEGYVVQTPNQIVRTANAQSSFNVAGLGTTVALIDTGVDPTNSI